MRKVLFVSILCLIAFISSAQTIQRVTSMEFHTQLDSLKKTESLIIIDGRGKGKYGEGHILGAVNVDAYSDDVTTQLMKYMNTKTIVVYCMENTRSEAIIQALKEIQYQGVIIDITDGYTGWTGNNLPVEK